MFALLADPTFWRAGRLRLARRLISVISACFAFWLIPMSGVAQTPVQPTVDQPAYQRLYQDLVDQIKSPAISGDLGQLVPIAQSDIVARLAKFRTHSNDNSRLDESQAPTDAPGFNTKLTVPTQIVIQQSLAPMAAAVAGQQATTTLMSALTREQAWAAIEALENVKNFDAAALLAKTLLAGSPTGDENDLLCLVAARNMWLSHAGKAPEYDSLIAKASQSSNSDVASQATLWQQAVTQPQSAPAVILAYQIWETVHLDLHQREKSWKLTSVINQSGPAAFESVQQSSDTEQTKQVQLGRVASIVSEAGFQQSNEATINWAVNAAAALTQADPEDKLAPLYFYAYYTYAKDRFAAAKSEFEKVFMSGESCDVAANSGYLMANCLMHQEDLVGTLATLQTLTELYPGRKYVTPKALQWLQRLQDEKPALDAKTVSQYIDKHFRAQLNKARAQASKSRAKMVLAQVQSK